MRTSRLTGITSDFPEDTEPADVYVDRDSHTLNVNLRVWDPVSLSWVRMTQPNPELIGNVTANFEAMESMLTKLVKELKKVNIYMSLATETEITNDDVGDY